LDVTNDSMHASTPKDILVFNVTVIWLILSTIRQNDDVLLDTVDFFLFVMHDTYVANLQS